MTSSSNPHPALIGRAQAADPEFKKKSGTLFDHTQDRFGTPQQVRKLNDTEKKKLKDELGSIRAGIR